MTNDSPCHTTIISLDEDRCVNCHACIAACPVKACNDGSHDHVRIDDGRCIGCGRCLSTCTHGARSTADDLSAFFDALASGERIVSLVAPSVVANFPDEYLHLNGWLKSMGVAAVFDVAFGAELAAKSYAEYLNAPVARPVIATPCPVIVHYVQLYLPELIPHLAPLDTAMQHALKAFRSDRADLNDCSVAIISPCPAKKREFEQMGVKAYAVTFHAIRAYLHAQGIRLIDFAPGQYDGPEAGTAACVPTPGGLLRAVERLRPGTEQQARKIEGTSSIYAYLNSLPRAMRETPEALPLFIDCLSCDHGCNIGPASTTKDVSLDAVEQAIRTRCARSMSATTEQAPLSVIDAAVERRWNAERYTREFSSLADGALKQLPSPEQLHAIYAAMHKHSDERLYNCCSCGYGSCEAMAVAIHNGLNRPENCHHYLMRERERAQEQIARHQEELEKAVRERTAELREANDQLLSEVAERQRAETALFDSEQKLKDIVHGAPVAQFVVDREHRVIYWNKAIEELTGVKAENVLGTRDHWRAFYDEPRPCLVDLMLGGNCKCDDDCKCVEEQYPKRWRKSALLPDTYEVTELFPNLGVDGKWLTFIGAVVKDAKGEVVGALETLEDVTERRRAEHALAKSREEAQAANIAKSQFLANMSHEIRTPLTAILGFSELITEACSSEDGGELELIRANSETILNNATHLLGVINDILDLARIESGAVRIDNTPFAPGDLMDDVCSSFAVQAAAKGLRLETEGIDQLPSMICTDRLRLRQILVNLVGNAVKFTEHGFIRIGIRGVRQVGSNCQLDIEVADSGPGMTQQTLSKLFTPFSQADDSMSRRHGGTGLGLAISQRLAHTLGGRISVRSKIGEGSVFRLSILTDPAAEDGQPEESPVASPINARKECAHKLQCRILVAEDGIDNQRLLSVFLTKAGAEVVIAENGAVAVELAHASLIDAEPFDVILMDMQMPVLDGYSATKRLRESGWRGPIVALTAHAMTGDEQRCLDAGCDAYLSKPINRERLLTTCSHVCRGVPS